MCGIVGYASNKESGVVVVTTGLQSLEYRGYDSAGIAYLTDQAISVRKQPGRVQALIDSLREDNIKTHLAIGHTRWATHGAPTTANSHPHTNKSGTIAVVHNGIIENHAEIRSSLQKLGYEFISETDTEVIPQLLDYYAGQSMTFEEAFVRTLRQLRGAYGMVVMSANEPERLFAARLGSPLVLGITASRDLIIASDPTALLAHTKEVLHISDHEYLIADTSGHYSLHNIKDDTPIQRKVERLDYDANESSLGDFPHYMLKEIFEAPQTIRAATLGRIRPESDVVKLGGLEGISDQLKHIDRIVIVACGTSYYAGMIGEYLLEEIAGIPVEVQLASEFKYRDEPFSRGTALLAISQSGETADTIAALKKAENYGVLRLGIVNAVGSTIARMTDAGVYCHAGPEQAVASTKAFIAQVSVLTLFALYLSDGKSPLYRPLLNELNSLPQKAEQVLASAATIKETALHYKDAHDFLFVGRKYGYPCALEGALKLKEVSYIHAEGYAAGEMKHGPLAMIDPHFPSLAIATDNELLEKVYSNIEEIRARKGPIVSIGTEGNITLDKISNDTIYIPKTMEQTSPLLIAIVMQLFAYYIAVEKDMNVDRPRNLAKSVTVE